MENTLGILDIGNVRTSYEANPHLIFRASEVIQTLNVPDSQYNFKEYQKKKKFYEDTKRVLQTSRGLSQDVCDACDKAIEDVEKITFRKNTRSIK